MVYSDEKAGSLDIARGHFGNNRDIAIFVPIG